MKKTLEWGGKKLDIEAVRFKPTKEYTALSQVMGDGTDLTPAERLANVETMLELLNCPAKVLDDLYPEQVNDLLAALEKAHWGIGDEGNPQGGE